jgi:hypothetical protein
VYFAMALVACPARIARIGGGGCAGSASRNRCFNILCDEYDGQANAR